MARTFRHHSRIARLALASLAAIVVLLAGTVATAQAVEAQPSTTTTPAATTTTPAAGQGAGAGAGRGAGAAAGRGAGTKSGNGLGISIDTGAEGGASTAIQVLVVMTVLALAPSILIMMTGFTRILIVMGFVRNALGTPTMPPNQVLIGLSMFLTLFVMFPTFSAINETAIKPYQDKAITQQVALDNAQAPLREFMFTQVDEDDLALFVRLADQKRPETRADVPTHVLIPAFLISELKTAFQIGFLIFVPFLIIDMVVASTLMSMGMIMLPPVMISLPFKILLFVLVDGWGLTIESLVVSFGGT
ncbi:MAG: fliP [Thermoleophilia bacterium]|nr:fliP [Thermoleophilia bacterium]